MYPSDPEYRKIRTLCIGTLLQLVTTSSDICAVVSQLCFGEALLRAVFDADATPQLIIMAADLLFELAIIPEARAEFELLRENCLEEVASSMVGNAAVEVILSGIHFVTQLSMQTPSKKIFAENGTLKVLGGLLKRSDARFQPLRLKVLHAILNLSTHPTAQLQICKRLNSLLTISRKGNTGYNYPAAREESRFALSILANMSKNSKCRTIMERHQLSEASSYLRPEPLPRGDADDDACSIASEVSSVASLSPSVARPFTTGVSLASGGTNAVPQAALHMVRKRLRSGVTSLWEARSGVSQDAPPMRSSHRIGPVVDEAGEDRWKPRLVAGGFDRISEQSASIQLEPAVAPYSRFVFDSRPHQPVDMTNVPVHLAKFDHVPGARVYASIFPLHKLPGRQLLCARQSFLCLLSVCISMHFDLWPLLSVPTLAQTVSASYTATRQLCAKRSIQDHVQNHFRQPHWKASF